MLCYLARARFSWFFINPAGVALVSVWGLAHGIFVLWAFILGELFTRLLGAKGFEQYYMPAAFGFAIGHGVLYWITAVIAFVTRAIPAIPAYLNAIIKIVEAAVLVDIHILESKYGVAVETFGRFSRS
ncbi:MAG: hypothetical protein QW320_09165 [Ignisphaera sp.]